MKEQIIKWINSGRNFDQGITLMYKYCRNKAFIRNIEKNPKKNAGKLLYELSKLAGYSAVDYPQLAESTTVKESAKNAKAPLKLVKGGSKSKPIKPEKPKELPNSVKRVIHEAKELLNERTELHGKLSAIPEDNAPDNIKARKVILEEIKILSDRMEVLFFAKDDYFKNGTLPDIRKLFPKYEDKKPAPKKLDGAELMKKKKNLESSLAKDRNLLKYQNKTKLQKENPMPNGPKRQVIADRVKDKEKELEDINAQLNVG